MTLEQEIQEILRERESISVSLSNSSRKVEDLIERVRSGKATTGNKVRDFTISLFGINIDIEKHEKPYMKLVNEVDQNIGSLVVMDYENEDVHSGIIPKSHYERNTGEVYIIGNLKTGILTGKSIFDVKEGRIILPTQKYADRWRFTRKWEIKTGPIEISDYEATSLGKKIETKTEPVVDTIRDTQNSLLVYVGDEAQEYLQRKVGSKDYQKILASLS